MSISNERAEQLVSELDGVNVNMTQWEEEFICEMTDWSDFTDEQKDKIEEIHSKYVG